LYKFLNLIQLYLKKLQNRIKA